MKTNSTRCLLCLLVIGLFLSTLTPLKVNATTDLPLPGEPWCQTIIYPEEEIVAPTTIIIYLPGAGHTGSTKKELERFARANHPLKYSREGNLEMPDDCIMICFQSQAEGEFKKKSSELAEVIHAISESCPNAKIILAGHSNGCLATYKIAASKNPDVDGYVFISGLMNAEDGQLPLMPNCMVVYGSEDLLARRTDFSNLFYNTDISDKKYREDTYYVEDVTNNAYILNTDWTHGTAPEVFLEDFFWEWVSNVTPLTEESD